MIMYVTISCSTSLVYVYNSVGSELFKFEVFANDISPQDVAFHRDYLFTAGPDIMLRIWDPITGKCLRQLEGHRNWVVSVDAKNNVILSGDETGQITIWSLDA